MRERGLGQCAKLLLLAVMTLPWVYAGTVAAETASSHNYQVTETQFGSGSAPQNCSNQYCAHVSIGDMSGGSAAGDVHSATFGKITGSDPLLEVIVDAGESDLGVLTTEKTATKTMIVRVRNYLSDGYTLQIVGEPPKLGNHTLVTPAVPTAAQPGSEQFAINAAANAIPNVGAGPVQVPSNQTSFGIVTDEYRTPNLFKYTSGDVIGRSASASGQTDYTISMIINISSATPAGHYAGDFAAIVVPVY